MSDWNLDAIRYNLTSRNQKNMFSSDDSDYDTPGMMAKMDGELSSKEVKKISVNISLSN